MIKVAIGSKNPIKIECVKQAFTLVWPKKKFEFEGIEVNSGVSNQPMNDLESIRGATNRARAALEFLNADFGVGLEGGLQQIGGNWFETGWVFIVNKNKTQGIGSSIRMQLSDKMMQMIYQGKELGEVNDIIFNKINSKHGDGFFGAMSNNLITRRDGYRDGVISALVRFIHPEVFKD